MTAAASATTKSIRRSCPDLTGPEWDDTLSPSESTAATPLQQMDVDLFLDDERYHSSPISSAYLTPDTIEVTVAAAPGSVPTATERINHR